jgi:valyl-tRNA synthetase
MDLDFHKMEQKWQAYWEKNKTYKFDPKSKQPVYSIDSPPPTVSGTMHLGHAFAFAQQDFIARYKKMCGFNVFHPFGFDNNGLATALMVEKKLAIKQKNFARNEFIKIVLKETAEEERKMLASFKSIGLSVDWSLLYRTIDELARKTAQYSFLDLFKQGRLYQKDAPTMWCPSCETAVAQAELEDREIESTFNDIVFKTEQGKEVIIATTRPELLPACVAVFVHPSDARFKHLVGKKLSVPLFDLQVPVLEDPRADPEKGTGIVMCCTFGDQTDMEWYQAHNLPMRVAITKDGRMNELAGKYKGMTLTEARKAVIEQLKKEGLLKAQKPITHAVNVHERCKAEMEILPSKQWFIRYLDLKDEYIVKADALQWVPKFMKSRYDNWIKGLQWDWCISRQRYYGVPFPVWYCSKCGEVMLAEEKQLPVDPLKDKPSKKCKCGSSEFVGEKDTLDTWFISSLTPQINCKWAEDSAFFKKMFPMDLRPQGHDIIALWAFNTIVKALFHQRQLPWKTITINGWALDSKGKKMSKSLGNVIKPEEMIEKYCADALRYWAGLPVLGEDVPFMEKEMVAGKKFLVKLHNAAMFVANSTKGAKDGKIDKKNLMPEDKAILSKLNRLIKECTDACERFEFSKALNPARNFFWLEFADFYIEEVKTRVYNKKDKSGKIAAAILQEVMWNCLLLLAPFLPHTTEEIAQMHFKKRLKGKSIHLLQWPTADEKMIDEKAEQAGELINAVIAAMRKEKSKAQKPMNAEVKKAIVSMPEPEKLKQGLDTIKRTMNAKEIELKKGELGVELEF